METMAIDPGTVQSGWVILREGKVRECGISPNEDMLERLRVAAGYVKSGLCHPQKVAIERFEARGMPIGDDSIETLIWTGRFRQAAEGIGQVVFVRRSFVKLTLCGTSRAKDPNVRQALIDLLGAPGTKKAPGPTYGVTSHAWAALGVAVAAERLAA